MHYPETGTSSEIEAGGHSSSFWSALNDKSHANLGLPERQRVKIWVNRAYQEIEQLSV